MSTFTNTSKSSSSSSGPASTPRQEGMTGVWASYTPTTWESLFNTLWEVTRITWTGVSKS